MGGALYLSAAHKSSGKTTLSIGLGRALRRRGRRIRTCKKGPDYIDPLWHQRATGLPCFNLDFNTQSTAEIRHTFAGAAAGADVTLVEGNHGLHDGVSPDGRDSNAAMARLLDLPVLLVMDVSGLARSVAPLVLGQIAFDPQIRIGGVILNKVANDRHEAKLRSALETYTDLPILGAVHRHKAVHIPERHLGLVPSNEAGEADAVIDRIADVVAAGVDLNAVETLAATAPMQRPEREPELGPEPEREPERATRLSPSAPSSALSSGSETVRLAIARDAAFGFYYPDDLAAFAAAGAQLVAFDTLRDPDLPPDCDGLFIGGGFPETHMTALEANSALRGRLQGALAAGLPTYAECGGLMYLCRRLRWGTNSAAMVGALPADCVMTDRPVGRGHARLRETGRSPWGSLGSPLGNPLVDPLGNPLGNPLEDPLADSPAVTSGPAPLTGLDLSLPAHEFHYSRLENLPADPVFAFSVERGHGMTGEWDGLVVGNCLAGYTHLRQTAHCRWVERFVSFVRTVKSLRK